MKQVSVIIPCYNAVDSIDRCLQSVVDQTIGVASLEIILVNDASTDHTLEKLYAWEKKYPQSVMVIDCEENGKQGCARNIGMQYATGEYIGFADDDDVLEDTMFEILYQAAVVNKCDVSVGQSVKHDMHTPFHIEQPESFEQVLLIETVDERIRFFERDINIAIWNKIYKREFLMDHEIYFLPGYIYDDIFFSALVKRYCQRVFITNQVLYHHIISDKSVSYSMKNKLDRIGFLEVHMALVEELRQRGLYDAYSEWYEKEFMVDYISFMFNYAKLYGTMEEQLSQIIRENVVRLFPNYKEIPLVKGVLCSEEDTVYRKILQELEECG